MVFDWANVVFSLNKQAKSSVPIRSLFRNPLDVKCLFSFEKALQRWYKGNLFFNLNKDHVKISVIEWNSINVLQSAPKI